MRYYIYYSQRLYEGTAYDIHQNDGYGSGRGAQAEFRAIKECCNYYSSVRIALDFQGNSSDIP